MQALWDRLDEMGVPPGDAAVAGERSMRFKGSRKHYGGGMVDEYVPRTDRIDLRRVRGGPDGGADGQVLLSLVPGDRGFEKIDRYLSVSGLLPLYDMIEVQGGPAPRRSAGFLLAADHLHDLWDAEGDALSLLLGDREESEEQRDRAAWARLNLAGPVDPAERGRFVDILHEFRSAPYQRIMAANHYWTWFLESEATLQPDGTIRPEVRSRVDRVLESWVENMEPDDAKRWLTRNFKVHPRHRSVFEAVVDEAFVRKAAREGEGSPGMRR